MLQIDHRESHDIDLFLDDPQYLTFLNTETQGIKLERAPDSYQAGTDVLTLAYEELGEIDFICCHNFIVDPTAPPAGRGHAVALAPPSALLAQNCFHPRRTYQQPNVVHLP